MSVVILPAAERPDIQWKNGGGLAAEVIRRGRGDAGVSFDWRIALATITEDGPFSDFSGVDRFLMSVSPAGLALDVDGRRTPVGFLDVLAFDGGATVSSVGVEEPALVLNVMVCRGRCAGSLSVARVDGNQLIPCDGGELVVIVVTGAIAFGDRELSVHDAVVVAREDLALAGSGVVAIARIASVT